MSGRVMSRHGLDCVRRVVSGGLQETTGSAGSCCAGSSSAPVQPVPFTRLGQDAGHPLYISIRFRRFGHCPVLASCRVQRVGVSAGLYFLSGCACRFSRFACPYRFIRLCSTFCVKRFPLCETYAAMQSFALDLQSALLTSHNWFDTWICKTK